MLSPILTPMLLLLSSAAITALAAIAYWAIRTPQQRALAELARSWNMHYSARDVFHLASRIAPHLPILGAANIRVRDLIYGTEPSGHRYIFSADYTAGVVRSKARRRFVVCVLEPRSRTQAPGWSSIQVAPDDLPLLEQYRSLKKTPEE